MMEMIR